MSEIRPILPAHTLPRCHPPIPPSSVHMSAALRAPSASHGRLVQRACGDPLAMDLHDPTESSPTTPHPQDAPPCQAYGDPQVGSAGGSLVKLPSCIVHWSVRLCSLLFSRLLLNTHCRNACCPTPAAQRLLPTRPTPAATAQVALPRVGPDCPFLAAAGTHKGKLAAE